MGKFRVVKVFYSDGSDNTTEMNGKLKDKDIEKYFKIGKEFNIGSGSKDNIVKVKSIEILESKQINEEVDIKKIIKDLGDTNWSVDNDAQMKASQLIKGLSISDEKLANDFMKLLDKASSEIAKVVLGTNEEIEDEGEPKSKKKKNLGVKDGTGPCSKDPDCDCDLKENYLIDMANKALL